MSKKPWSAMRIVHLVEVPEVLPTLKRWFIEAWEPWYGPDGAGDAAADLAACCRRDDLPFAMVALDEAGGPLGTAALKWESVGSETGAGPWLAALVVGRAHRGKGVATSLIVAIEREAERLGFATIYASTDAAARMLHRRGWQETGATESLRGAVAIYQRHLRPHTVDGVSAEDSR